MPEQYFSQTPTTPHKTGQIPFTYQGNAMLFTTDAGTFSKGRIDPGSELLLEAMSDLAGACADIGCGWGAIGLSLACANPDSTWLLVDINQRAVALAQENASRNSLTNVKVRICDGLSGVTDPLHHIVTNPPIRAGKEVVYGFFAQAHALLVPDGTFTCVIRKQQGALSAKDHLRGLFGNCTTIKRGGGYHVLRCYKEL